jgi:hypothetical protein
MTDPAVHESRGAGVLGLSDSMFNTDSEREDKLDNVGQADILALRGFADSVVSIVGYIQTVRLPWPVAEGTILIGLPRASTVCSTA